MIIKEKKCNDCVFCYIRNPHLNLMNKCNSKNFEKIELKFKNLFKNKYEEKFRNFLFAKHCEYYLPNVDILTEKQKDIFLHIKEFIERNGYPPTYRDISDKFLYSSIRTAMCHIEALKRKNFITYEGLPRTINLIGYEIKLEPKG